MDLSRLRQFWIVYLLVFLVCLFLYSLYNGFPSDYHPDEHRKAEQVASGQFNFHHPLLLINTARFFAWVTRVERTEQKLCLV